MGENHSEALAVFLSPGARDRPEYASARSLANRCLGHARSLDGVRVFVYTDPRHEDWVRDLLPADPSIEIRLEGPHDREGLPRKVQGAFSTLFEEGYGRVVGIAADTPRLTEQVLNSAFSRLRGGRSRAVVGPSRDGGFYLLGLNSPQENLLDEVPFYRSDTCERLFEVLEESVGRVSSLERLADVDALTDWLGLDRGWILRNFSRLVEIISLPTLHQRVPQSERASGRTTVPFDWSSRAPPVFSYLH